ncbi:beta-propeller fold lactonase family protein [Nonomuraea sp. NPDC049269]|uniref:beta-propeller fold lactonase family protein n=1 Tax=Nonomuraea sp. NPDC049269 TaxID=3364349 RepID=UPI003720AAA9
MLTKLGLLATLIGLPLAITPAVPHEAPTPRSVYVTNILSNNITRFAIQQDGGLTADTKLTATDAAPRGIVISPDARTVYVANGTAGTITTYRVGADGGLTALSPSTPTPADPDDAVVSPDGQRLYVISRSAAMVTMFPIASDGRLTTPGTSVPVLGENPRGIAMTPDGRNLYVTTGDPVADTEPDVLVRFAVQEKGTLKRLGTTPIGAAGGAMALTPDGRFLFVPCAARHEGEASHEVFVFRVDSDGALTPVPDSPFPAPDVPIAAAVTPDGRNLYVTDGGLIGSGSRLVSAYTIRANGSLDHIADVKAGKSPVALAPAPDARWLYVSNLDSNDASAFRIKPGGELEELDGSPYPTGGMRPAFQSIAVLPNQGPQAALAVGETTGLEARFDASTSSDPDGNVVRYDWAFGDGTVLRDGGPRPTHRFPAPGTYQVTLVITDDQGCSTGLIFTGTSTQCNGSARASAQQAVTVTSGLGGDPQGSPTGK